MTRAFIAALLLAAASLWSHDARAQATAAGITPCGNGLTLSVSNTSSNVQLNACGSSVVLWNIGSTEVFFNLGAASSTVAAAATSLSLPAGGGITLNTGRAPLYLAAITASSTSTLRIVQGNGAAAIGAAGGSGGGGGGGAVTIADGADVTQGTTTDAACGTDNGTCTDNSVLKRIAQRITTLIGSTLNVSVTNANANGQATMANSSPVVIASNQSAFPVTLTSTTITGTVAATQSGTWTVQPGNTPNTTPWLLTSIPSAASGAALTTNTCGSAVSSCVLKASAGNFYGAYAECTSACWLMVFNATSAPSNGSTTAGTGSGNLVDCIDISAGSSKSITYPTYPKAYSVGITVAISSTACATLTLSTVGFVSGSVM